jgi:serine/threonine protein kinase
MLGEKPISEHPLVPKLVARFRTKDALVMVMERVAPIVSDLWALIYDISELQGRKGGGADDAGKLSKVLSRRRNSATSHMTSDMIKFYLASVVVVLSDLHKAGIAFRNLKAENVLIDATGYIKLTGFGHAKRFPLTDGQHMKNRTHTVCGTAEYMAPEIIMHSGHNLSADAWALGCLMYELLEGKTPFATAAEVVRNRGGRRMLSRAEDADCRVMAAVAETQHKGVRLNPAAVSELEGIPGALPLITGFLNPVPANRLLISTKPSSDIVKSPFFKDFDWAALRNLTLPAPFQPTFPAETSDEEKERIRREAELAALAALASAPVAYVKPSYLESTVASVASRAEEAERRKVAEKRRNERRDDEVVEAKHSPFFDASVPYGGDNSIFAEF